MYSREICENLPIRGPRSKAAVLLVEDDPTYCRLVDAILHDCAIHSFEVIAVPSLHLACDQLSARTFDVVLLDLGLPDGEGLSSFRRLKHHAPDTAIVVLTGSDDFDAAHKVIAEGAQDYLVKQHTGPESLVRSITFAMERKSLQRTCSRASAIEDFMAALAHDVQVPLLGTRLVLDAFCNNRTPIINDEQQQVFRIMEENNERSLQLIRRLLLIYTYETSAPLSLDGTVDLVRLCEDAIAQHNHLLKQRELTIRRNFESACRQVRADAQSLILAIGELIDNALKYSDVGSEILIEMRKDSFGVTIFSIANVGDELPGRVKAGRFQRFWSGIPGKQYVHRTGIGLYLAGRIVDLNGGNLECTSYGTRTTFTITLPEPM